MRCLAIHTGYFRFEARQKATPSAESLPPDRRNVEIERECLVLFISVEKGDAASPGSVAAQFVADVLKRTKQVGVDTVVIYPYVHLTENPSTSLVAIELLKKVESGLAGSLNVVRAPFGWYKAFDVSCLGHPLSESSARYSPVEKTEVHEKLERKPSEFTRFVVVDTDGNPFEITRENFERCPIFLKSESVYGILRQFVSNELSQGVGSETAPKHIDYMRRHELVDYCDVSEKGHYKWYPNGVLIQKLILDYASRLAHEWGAVEMKNPILIRGDHNVVGELMGEFHERDYQVDGGRGICYLRYASDPVGFPFMENVRFSHKQSPLKVYEEATCFRNEQEGEVSGLKRVRNFMMTDMHAACATKVEAHHEFEILSLKFAGLMDDIIAKGRWVLGWEGTVDFFEANRAWLIDLGKRMNVPAFFKLMPHMSHYYTMKNEYQFINEDRSNIQVSTVQWDIKDGERFNIGFTDEQGRKHPCPVIVHASSFGSIERTLCAILENIAVDASKGVPPMFPLWLAPTQVRVIPVTDSHLPFAKEICDVIASRNIRVDLDDRGDTVGKKIRNGEKAWIPYMLVVGNKEQSTGRLNIRSRENREQIKTNIDGLVKLVHRATEGMPFRPLPVPQQISRRPLFYG